MTDVPALRRLMERLSRETGFAGEFRFAEVMASYTTFRAGDPADLWVRPASVCFPEYAAADIRALVNAITEKVRAAMGFVLEPEILFVGEWV